MRRRLQFAEADDRQPKRSIDSVMEKIRESVQSKWNSIQIDNLHSNYGAENVKMLCLEFGEVCKAEYSENQQSFIVVFEKHVDAKLAIDGLNGRIVGERRISVDWTKTEAESERKEKEKEAMDEVELEKRAIAKIGEKRLQEFDRILFNLTTSRESIKIALACAMENSEYYAQIVDRIKTSVMEENIGIPRRIARLYLVSDLLHNSGCADIKNAWKFRHEFQKHLLEIFVRLRKVFVGINGRITAEAMKERVMIVLRAWNQWSIYPRDLISQLEDTFLGHAPKHSETTEPKSPVQDIPDDYCDPNWDIDGEPLF